MSLPWVLAFSLLWLTVVVIALVVIGLVRRVSGVLEQIETRVSGEGFEYGGVPPGSVVGEFELHNSTGRSISSMDLLSQPTLLLFMEPGCGSCRKLASDLAATGDSIDGLPLFVVLDDSPTGSRLPVPANVPVLFQIEGAVSRVFRNVATPQAFVVDIGGFVLERSVPNTVRDLRRLAKRQEGGVPHDEIHAAAVRS